MANTRHRAANVFDLLAGRLRRNSRTIAVDLPSDGELQFILPVIEYFISRNPSDRILIIYHGELLDETLEAITHIKPDISFISNQYARSLPFVIADLFITSEQYSLGLGKTYSVCLFHGQPSKGLTFTKSILQGFDAYFLYGPLHHQAYIEFLSSLSPKLNSLPRIFRVGYPKSDKLILGHYYKVDICRKYIPKHDQTILLYAPAFNYGASLREFGIEIITTLCSIPGCSIIVKLPIDCWLPASNIYANGGIDWFNEITRLTESHNNLFLYKDFQIDPLLACSDILITCISSVSFEFLALNKPVVFIDTPKFFSQTLKQIFPYEDTESWAHRTTINGGKEFGPIVANPSELISVIHSILHHPNTYPYQQDKLRDFLLYNPGRGTQAAVAELESLLAAKVKSKRPWFRNWLIRMISNLLVKPIRSFLTA